MTLTDPATQLQALHEASERISANLVDLEIDSGRQLLEASTLSGISAERWSRASAALTELWRRHGLLEELLHRADELRGSRNAEALRELLSGPAIELASADVPLSERQLLGNAQEGQRCGTDQLLADMSAAFDEVKTVVVQIGAAWEALIPKLDTARRLLQDASRLSGELGEPDDGELGSAAQTLDALSQAVTADPLSVRENDVEALTRSLTAIREDLEHSAALKRGFEGRMLDVQEQLRRLRATLAEAQSAREELLVKISVPAAPPPPQGPSELESELPGITAMAQNGAWREARRALEDWSSRTDARLDQARRACESMRAPIEARNQFRSLLEAYQVKAKRLGRLEDPRVAEIFTQAHTELFTAPTDLPRAAQLVRSYQEALSANPSRPEHKP